MALPALLAVGLVLAGAMPAVAQDQAEGLAEKGVRTPDVSKAMVEDLLGQADEYVAALAEAVASEDAYNDSKEDLARDSNTLIVIVWVLGSEAGRYGPPGVMAAAEGIADAKDYPSAKKAVGQLKTAIGQAGKANGPSAAAPRASLSQLMKEVPILSTKLKRNVQGDRLKSKAKETAGASAVLAAIALGSSHSTEAAKTPEQVAPWKKFCDELRKAASATNAGIHAGDAKATAAAMTRLNQSCDDCHAVFHKEADKDK